MIKLKINPDSQANALTFDKNEILIGNGSRDSVDILVPENDHQNILVRITLHDGKFQVINASNDPLVTLNGSPFWKKTLAISDRIQIGKTVIQLTELSTSSKKEELDELDQLLQQVEELIELESNEKPVVATEIKDLIPPAEKEPAIEETVIAEPAPAEISHVSKKLIIIDTPHNSEVEEPAIPDLEDITPASIQEQQENLKPRSPIFSNFKFYISISFAIFIALFLSSVIFYVRINGQSYKEKIIASEGVADVAMALTYAQVYHLTPQRQNWIDPEFLKTNLSTVLSPGYPSFANIDNMGQFLNCPYILRIYTTSDLSEFLVIAQPEPSLLQWLVPKESIALDSRTMVLHSIEDIKVLNRLLASSNSIDDSNSHEIAKIMEQSPTIPLALLGAKKGFSPPKALALIHPGAEDLVYNSPRYYHFGEALLKRSVALLQDIGNATEISRLQQEAGELNKFPNMVLYSSQSIDKALQSHKALAVFVPDNSFLGAYLSFNNKGMVASSHLLFDGNYLDNQIAMTEDEEEIPSGDDFYERQLLLSQLKALAADRHNALKEISDDIIALVHNNTTGQAIAFSERFPALITRYQSIDEEYKVQITDTLKNLFDIHTDLTSEQFTDFIKAAGLWGFTEETPWVTAENQ